MSPILTGRTAVVVGLLAATALQDGDAHHSVTGSFDPGHRIQVTGEVVEWRFRNPHSLLVVDGIATIDGAADASPHRWEIESSPSASMREMGFDENTFFPGRKVTISGIPHRNPSLHRINAFANRGAFRDEEGNPIGEGSSSKDAPRPPPRPAASASSASKGSGSRRSSRTDRRRRSLSPRRGSAPGRPTTRSTRRQTRASP
jgi:hypothetical protein